jgi:hypothetical protein
VRRVKDELSEDGGYNLQGLGRLDQGGLHRSTRDAARSHQQRPAHDGELCMGLRAEQFVYWPRFWSDIEKPDQNDPLARKLPHLWCR